MKDVFFFFSHELLSIVELVTKGPLRVDIEVLFIV